MIRIFLLIFLWALLAGTAYAAPGIVSYSGTIQDGESVTIFGSGFGNTLPTVYKWDDFESHATGEDVGAGPGDISWSHTNAATNPCQISSDSPRTGSTKHARANFYTSSIYRGGLYFAYGGATPSPVYISWHWRYILTGSESDNWKPFWPVGLGSTPNGPRVSICYGGECNVTIIADENKAYIERVFQGAPTKNNWVRYDFYGEQSTPNTSDGTIILRRQTSTSSKMIDVFAFDGNVKTRGDTSNWDRSFFGDYADAGSGVEIDIDFDDVYIANSRARIEIGNDPVFTDCTHAEIQIPTAWTSSEITFTVNRGSFAADDTAYLFVIDEDGGVSDGYEITFGEEGAATIRASGTAGWR